MLPSALATRVVDEASTALRKRFVCSKISDECRIGKCQQAKESADTSETFWYYFSTLESFETEQYRTYQAEDSTTCAGNHDSND